MEWCAVVRDEEVCLEVSGLDTDTTEPERSEFLMKTLRDPWPFDVSVPPSRVSSQDTLPRTAYFDALYKLSPAPALYRTGDSQPLVANV